MSGGAPDIAARLERLRLDIATAARNVGRDPASVNLVAVSKTHGVEAIAVAYEAGQSRFGENRVQEAAAKFPGLRARHPDIELHLVGSLQRNKALDAVLLFDVIHSLDRAGLAEAIARAGDRVGRVPRCLIQVNTGREPQKSGVEPDGLDDLLARAHALGLPIIGLMCVPPADADPAPHFAWLAEAARARALPELSMGMSGDFEQAIAHSATLIRVGSAIFGSRPPLTGR